MATGTNADYRETAREPDFHAGARFVEVLLDFGPQMKSQALVSVVARTARRARHRAGRVKT